MNEVKSTRIQRVRAIKVLACPNCQAPGMWKYTGDEYESEGKMMKNTEKDAYLEWPGICTDDEMKKDVPVGESCPNCNSERTPNEDLGEIWRKDWQ